MKKFTAPEETVLIGTTAEIKAVYGSIYRAWENGKTTWMMPTFTQKSLFSVNRTTYGILFTETENSILFEVITSDCFCKILLNGSLKEV